MKACAPPIRAEFERPLEPLVDAAPERALPLLSRLWQHTALRKTVIVALLAAVWELVARLANNELLLPTFTQTARALVLGVASGELIDKARISIALLLQGYLLGIACAFALTALAVTTRFGRDLLGTLTAMFNPLPAIALLPLALATFAGFQGVPETLRMAGRNYGLRGLRFVVLILVPSALPAILSGLRIGWAFAWRTLIAAELFFGASSGQGGLGWYIFQNRNELYTDKVFAGLASVILIGLLVESLGFDTLERITVRRWGVQR